MKVVHVIENHLGRAVIANCHFAAGETIGAIRGRIVEDPDYWSDYCIELDDGTSLEPFRPFRFLNHSCEPNCEIFMWEHECVEQRGRVLIGARKAIQPGQQLTIDYAWPANATIPCLCKSKGCRGWIVAAEELGKLKRHMAK